MSLPARTLNACHPDHDAEALTAFDALYEGGACWHKLVAKWLPQNAQEPDDLWRERKDRASYENHAAPIVDLIVAWLFSKPPAVEGMPTDWLDDVDRRGSGLALWARETVTAALRDRRAYVWVNLPARPAGVEVATRADEDALGLNRPFLVRLGAQEVRRWWEDAHGNLRALLFRQVVERDSGVESDPAKVWVWTYIDTTQIRRWEWTATKDKAAPAPEESVEELAPIAHGMKRLPVARLELPAGLHVLQKLHDPIVALTRLSNDLDWSLHRWANSLLVLAVADAAQAPILGAGYYLQIGKDDKVYAVAPDASGFESMFKRLQDRREEVYRVVQQMASGVSGESTQQASSAASKAMDWQSLEVMLAAYAALVKGLLRAVCQIAAGPLSVAPDKVAVGGLEGWQEEETADLLADLLAAVPLVKSETFRREVAKRTVRAVLPEVDEAMARKIEGEIDAADYGEAPAWEGPPGRNPPAAGNAGSAGSGTDAAPDGKQDAA